MLTKTPKPSIPWKRAKTVTIPIPKTGTKFRQYPDMPLRPCEVSASFSYVPVQGGQAWYWRIKLDTPLFHTDDPDPSGKGGAPHRPAVTSGKAIEAAIDEVLRLLRGEVDIRRHHKQTDIAGACAQAVWHVEQFQKYFQETGKFRTKAIVPGGTKPREEFDAEVEAVQKRAQGGESPSTFSEIGREMRETLAAKLRKVWDLHLAHKIVLPMPDIELLSNFVNGTEPLTSRDKVQRAVLLVQTFPRRSETASHNTKPTTAIAVLPAATVTVEALAVEELSAEEHKVLARSESQIESGLKKSLEGLVISGKELRTIRDRRLYRRTHSTFEAYVADRWRLKKTSAYELIDGAAAYELAQPIAETLKIRFTAAAQLRPLTKLGTKADMKAVLQRAARKIEPDSHGQRQPTMEILAQAVHEENTDPDQLKREAAEKKSRAAKAAGTTRLSHIIAGIPAEALQADSAELPSRTSTAELPSRISTAETPIGAPTWPVQEYDGLIPPEGLPDGERQNWHAVLQSFSKETCQMAQYYRRYPGVGRKLQGFFLHLAKLVEITCTQEFPAGHQAPTKAARRAK